MNGWCSWQFELCVSVVFLFMSERLANCFLYLIFLKMCWLIWIWGNLNSKKNHFTWVTQHLSYMYRLFHADVLPTLYYTLAQNDGIFSEFVFFCCSLMNHTSQWRIWSHKDVMGRSWYTHSYLTQMLHCNIILKPHT